MTPVIVIEIGCLECSNPSDLLGIYDNVAQAIAAHPEAKLRSELKTSWDWGGSEMVVIFDVETTSCERAHVTRPSPSHGS